MKVRPQGFQPKNLFSLAISPKAILQSDQEIETLFLGLVHH